MAREALAAFEGTLAKDPNRLRTLAGAAKAADLFGNKAKAKGYYEKILAMVGDADSGRPEVGEACRSPRRSSRRLCANRVPVQ